MALLSGGSSRLNPNAPLYIPTAVRKVEDFSPEWYDLISTSTWYRDYWLSQRQEVDNLYKNKLDNLVANDNIVDMLPDEIDLGIEEDLSYMNSPFDGFAQSYEHHQGNKNIFTNDNKASQSVVISSVSFPAGSRFAAQPGRVPGKAN